MKNVFIIIPALNPTGPVKGAHALANALASQCKVTLVTIKQGKGANSWLDPRVNTLCLSKCNNTVAGIVSYYRSILRKSGGHDDVVSLSMCLSADFINLFCKPIALTCCSVRGNLFVNYQHDYGIAGIGLAFIHMFSLRWIDRVVAMNHSMARQIKRFSGCTPEVIGNFIDEAQFEKRPFIRNESDPLRFVFVGSLTTRKQPVLLISALNELHRRGVAAYVEYVGVGSEERAIEEYVNKLNLVDFVKFHGFLSEPESVVSKADVLVLPSLSEGISRAAMEALYLGIPCVLRDADGNLELLNEGVNGAVFKDDRDLPDAMLRAAKLARTKEYRECLLPSKFRQHIASRKYMEVMGVVYE